MLGYYTSMLGTCAGNMSKAPLHLLVGFRDWSQSLSEGQWSREKLKIQPDNLSNWSANSNGRESGFFQKTRHSWPEQPTRRIRTASQRQSLWRFLELLGQSCKTFLLGDWILSLSRNNPLPPPKRGTVVKWLGGQTLASDCQNLNPN